MSEQHEIARLADDGNPIHPEENGSPVVCLTMPRRGESVCFGAAQGYFFLPTNNRYPLIQIDAAGSILTHTFNSLWVSALNLRKTHGVTHFAMIHDDVCPQEYWLDILMDELLRLNADVVSAVIPQKNQTGVTSTAIADKDDIWTSRRLTVREVAKLPETFSIKDTDTPDSILLVNTGLWVCDLRKLWCERTTFRFANVNTFENDEFVAKVVSEDWIFSRDLDRQGARVYATRKVNCHHVGEGRWHTNLLWGQETDDLYWQLTGKKKPV